MLNKNQIRDFMSAMKENGDVSPMDVSLENMSIFADTQGVELDEVMEFCQIAEEMNFSSLDFNVPTEPGVSEQEIGLLAEDYRDWLKKNNLKNNLKSLQDYLKEKSQNEEVTKELLVKIPRYWSENKLTELSDEETPEDKTEEETQHSDEEEFSEEDYKNDPKFRRYSSMLRGFKQRGDMQKYKDLEDYIKRYYPKANISSILSEKKETTHSDEEEFSTPADPAKDEGKKGEEPKVPASEPAQMSDDEKKSAKEQLLNLKDKIAKSDFADSNSVKEFIECCGQVAELGKKFSKPEEFAKTVFDKPADEPKADDGKKPETSKTTPEGKPANFSGEDKPQKGKFDYFDLYIKK